MNQHQSLPELRSIGTLIVMSLILGVMILPMSSWPEELRPFAELLRP